MYKVCYRDKVSSLVGSLQGHLGSNKKTTGNYFHKRLREMVKQSEDQFDEKGY